MLCLDDIPLEERKKRLEDIYMPSTITDKIFQLTKDVTEALSDAEIPFMASYGTVLDLVRHQTKVGSKTVSGLKKHDDDVDLAIDLKDIERLKSLTEVFDGLGYSLLYDSTLSRFIVEAKERVKIFHCDKTLDFLNFVDIFVFKREGEKYILAEEEARSLTHLKNGWFTKEEFEKRKVYNFGPFKLSAPIYAEEFLKRAYGPKCLEEAYFSSNHINPSHSQKYRWTLSVEEKIPALPTKRLGSVDEI